VKKKNEAEVPQPAVVTPADTLTAEIPKAAAQPEENKSARPAKAVKPAKVPAEASSGEADAKLAQAL